MAPDLSKMVQGRNSGSLIHVGIEGWPVWSDLTDQLLLKKSMVVLIESCQNRQNGPTQR